MEPSFRSLSANAEGHGSARFHPVATSFGAALHKQVVTTLRSRGFEIDDCDLRVESFDPTMNEQERMEYHDATLNMARVAVYANRLLAADALVLVYPVWNEGFPAILKGFFDRVFIPGHPRGELWNRPRRHPRRRTFKSRRSSRRSALMASEGASGGGNAVELD